VRRLPNPGAVLSSFLPAFPFSLKNTRKDCRPDGSMVLAARVSRVFFLLSFILKKSVQACTPLFRTYFFF